MRVNIFICHTPFHNFICRNLCQLKFSAKTYKNIIISSVDDGNTQTYFTLVNIKDGLLGKLKGLQKAKKIIKFQVRTFKHEVEFFLPHIDGVLGNFIFHSASLQKAGAKINFFYDGVLMLDAHRETRTFPRLLVTKRLLSFSILHYFISYRDVLPVRSDRIKNVYTPLPSHTPGPIEKMIPIEFSSMRYDKQKGSVIILGSDVGEYLDLSYQKIVAYCRNSLGADNILFKPHHADKLHLFQKSMKTLNQSFDLVTGKACLEELISELHPEFVIAPYLSSALINIKVMFGADIGSICMLEGNLVETTLSEITQLAKSLGVEIVTFTKNLNE